MSETVWWTGTQVSIPATSYKLNGVLPIFAIPIREILKNNSYICENNFYNYEYKLDVSKQCELMDETKPLEEGLKDAFMWYKDNQDKVNKKLYIEYIEQNSRFLWCCIHN